MSFSENPFKTVTFKVNEEGRVHLECDSCGGGWRETWPASEVTALALLVAQARHVKNSHKRQPSDFERGGSW